MVQNTFKVAEVQVSYTPNYKVSDRPKITSSKQCYDLLIQHWDIGKIELLEQSKMLLLNRSNRILGLVDVSTGGVSGTVLDPKIIFSIALKANTSSIILCHNHPSGNTYPSQMDIKLTERLKEGGKLLDIKIFDHLIITRDSYFSLADEGLM